MLSNPTCSVLLCIMLLCPTLLRADVRIEAAGATDKVIDNVRAHLSLINEPCDTAQWRIQRMLNQVGEEVEPALRAFGYYNADISNTLTRDKQCWQVVLGITLPPPVKVTLLQIDIHGEAKQDAEFERLLRTLPLNVGDVLHHGRYEEIKSRLNSLALERGYFDAELSHHEMKVDPATHSAEIRLQLDSGPRYRFGTLELDEPRLQRSFLHRLVDLEPGTPYDALQLIRLDRSLSDAGYFQRVEIRPHIDRIENNAVPITITLEPRPRHAWQAGIGFATDTGPRLTFGYSNRLINPRGHRFDSELRLSPVETGLTANYTIPGSEPLKETFDIGTSLLHEDTDTSTSDSIRLTTRQTLRHEFWTETRFIELLQEHSEIGADRTTSTLLMPGISWNRSQSDNPLRTRRGYRLGLELRGAWEGLLSDATLVQIRANAKGIHRFGDAGRVTARTELGTTLGDDFFDLPASLRFFAGGDNSVRGYAYKSLGPKDSLGDVTGGRHLFTASLEYEHPLPGEDWWLAAFVDAGNAFNTREAEIEHSYGFGLRWYSPFGRLRLDIAFPSDTSDDSWRFHFGFGADL